MTAPDTNQQPPPWYRQFWPWFLIALPASAVVAGIATVIIATSNRDNLVVDNYYKEGLAINQKLDQQSAALQLGISAQAKFDPQTRQLSINLQSHRASTDLQSFGDRLKLTLAHATMAEHDQIVIVNRQNGNTFAVTLHDILPGRWHVILQPLDEQWRIEAHVNLPQTNWQLLPNI